MLITDSLLASYEGIDAECVKANSDTTLIRAKCRGLMAGYDLKYRTAEYEPLYVEGVYLGRLVNPETNRPSKTFDVAGKVDVVCKYHGKMVLFDHKTTSQDISDPDGSYWRQLVVEAQATHYMLLLWQNSIKCDDAVWDVVRKPQISPKKLTKAEVRSVVSSQEYFGRRLSEQTLAEVQTTERENTELYEARLAWDCTHERPEHYFQRRSVPRLDSELLDYATELWEHGQEIMHARTTERHARNSGACMLYNLPCKFLGICSGYDRADSDKWTSKAWMHNELPNTGGDGRNLLTNSRIRCFQTCRRKHFYQYEMGIERVDEQEREALLFGSVWHAGLERWFSYFLKGSNNGNGSDRPAGNGLASNATASQAILPF